MFKVFISHSTQYVRNVASLHQSLSGTGVTAFVDKESAPLDDQLSQELTAEIAACDLFLLIWSLETEGSARVAQEVEIARTLNKKILPLVRAESPTLLDLISDLKYVPVLVDSTRALEQARETMLDGFNIKMARVDRRGQDEPLIIFGLGAVLLWALGQE